MEEKTSAVLKSIQIAESARSEVELRPGAHWVRHALCTETDKAAKALEASFRIEMHAVCVNWCVCRRDVRQSRLQS